MDNLATLQVYKELADWYERQGQAAMRDRFLILAAEAAFSAGKSDEAERLRQRLLQGNPHHMLKPFSSFAQALQSTNIQIYIHDLQANYPAETAEGLLRNLRSGVPPPPTAAPMGASTLGELPQTAPLIEIHDEPTLPLSPPAEPLKVYPLGNAPAPTRPSVPPAKPTNLNRPSQRKPAPPPDRPSQLNTPSPRSQPTLPRSTRPLAAPDPVPPPPPPSEPAASAGAWLALLLFGMTVTAGVALAFYTFARPFLPREWLP
jgi:hypothetical protein